MNRDKIDSRTVFRIVAVAIATAAGAALLALVVIRIDTTIRWFVTATFLALVLAPAVELIERIRIRGRKPPRWAAISVTFAAAFVALGFLVLNVIPPMVDEVEQVGALGPQYVHDAQQWANDSEHTGPVEVEGEGTVNEGSMYNTFVDYKLRYRYANGVEMRIESGGTSLRFNGADGWVGNPGWDTPLQAGSNEIRTWQSKDGDLKLFTCRGGEHRNFLDCVKSRRNPYCPAEIGHRISTILHIGNIAMKLKRKLKWDPDKEEFPGDAEANAMRSTPMRKPWTLG